MRRKNLIEIEKSKDLKKLIMKELMGSLQAYDQKIKKKAEGKSS
jgi:hypothetical protein